VLGVCFVVVALTVVVVMVAVGLVAQDATWIAVVVGVSGMSVSAVVVRLQLWVETSLG